MTAHVSISSRMYARLSTAARARSISMSSIVEAALIALPPATVEPREVIDVSHRIYAMGGKRARREGQPINDTIDAAILAALDDAERFPPAPTAPRRSPRVDHAYRR